MTQHEALNLIRERLCRAFDVQKIVLFGSRGRGDAAPDSDYDVFVVADSDIPFIERQGRALRALGKRDFAIDLLVYTPAEAEREAAIPGSAIYWAQREGKEVYAK